VSSNSAHISGTLGEVAAVCGGEVEGRWLHTRFSGVSTDTRTLAGGEVFFALRGHKHDGHEFLRRALEAGAAAAVVSDPAPAPGDLPVVVVADTLAALGELAAAHRSEMPARVAAVTGSTGKTTTKDMLGGIMARVGAAAVAEGTQNNEIGVPLALLRLTPEHQFCVLELAMRGPGEIDYLARIARPDVGVITNIGQSHVGRLGSREAIARAKAELLEHIRPDGVAVLNADDFFFGVLQAMAHSRVLSFGTAPDADVRAEEIREHGLEGISFRLLSRVGEAEVRMQAPGRHNVMDALAASAAAVHLGAGLDDIVAALEAYSGGFMRMEQIRGCNGCVLINDAYNASPDSVDAALNVLRSAPGRRVFVFGDMLEMGPEAAAAHRDVGQAAAKAGVSWLIAVGELAGVAAERAEQIGVRADAVADASNAVALLAPELSEGDYVLIKGSRGMALERVVEALANDA